MTSRRCPVLASGTLALALSACVSLPESVLGRSVGADLAIPVRFAAPSAAAVPADGPEGGSEGGSGITSGLLSLFDAPALKTLVTRAQARNPDLRLAAARLEEAGFTADASHGRRLPVLTAGFAGSRGRDGNRRTAGDYSPSLDVSWEVDLWGRLRDEHGALEAGAAAQAETVRAAQDSIAARVMQTWFDALTAQKQLHLERARTANLTKIAASNRLNYQAGLAVLEDLTAVERDIETSRAVEADRLAARNRQVRTLQVLLGDYPAGGLALSADLPEMLPAPPAGLPAAVMSARPDLRAAWQRVVSADSGVKAAHKARLPRLTLTGTLGRQNADFSKLLSGATIWSLAAGLSAPLFDSGRLENEMKAAQSRAEQAWIAYLGTALTAFQEVERALDNETLLAERETRQQAAVRHAVDTADLFESRYRNGLVSILDLLTAQNAVFDLKNGLLTVRNERAKNRVALALALGLGV